MSVYDLDMNGLRKTFMKFHKTLYGRTVFIFAYLIPFVLFVIGTILGVVGVANGCTAVSRRGADILALFVPLFILGNIYFYSEVRKFCEHLDSKKK